jgi:tRNA A37 threonylcarbamoyltransferase TsaD
MSSAFPFLAAQRCLVQSGLVSEPVATQIGTTADDAIGEAFDKVARMLGLPLTPSGGPALEAHALQGDPNAYTFPVPWATKVTCDFSYSGLKSSARLAVERDVGDDLGPATLQVRAPAQDVLWACCSAAGCV